jgi:hypothetical protein
MVAAPQRSARRWRADRKAGKAAAAKRGRARLNKAVHALPGGYPGCCKILLYTATLSEYRWPFLGFRPGSLRIETDYDVTQLFESKYYIV